MRVTFVMLVLTGAACGGSGTPSSSTDVQALNTLAQDVSTAASAYGAQAGGMTDLPGCNAGEAGYDGQVRPMIAQMEGMGPAMDQMMSSLGHAGDADMVCSAHAMMAELDRHHAAACASTTDMGPNRTEAQHHVDAMKEWADHQLVRSHDMGTMMGSGMGGMGGGGMTTGHCVDQGGTLTMQP
jgi:hypothetical protein